MKLILIGIPVLMVALSPVMQKKVELILLDQQIIMVVAGPNSNIDEDQNIWEANKQFNYSAWSISGSCKLKFIKHRYTSPTDARQIQVNIPDLDSLSALFLVIPRL